MKKLIILGFTLFTIANTSGQTSYVWSGTTSSFTTTTNWTPNGTPGSTDDITYNATSVVNCDFDADIQVTNITITAGFTGTVNALATNPIITGNYSQAGGTFISTSDVSSGGITIAGNITLTGGSFVSNGGLVRLAVTDGITSSISGNITFNALSIVDNNIGGGQRNVNFGTSTTSTLSLGGATLGRLFAYQGTINILSNLTVLGSNTGNPSSNTGNFIFSGAGPVSITGSSAAARNKLPNVEVNTTGTITMTGHVNVQGNWTGTQGTLTVGSSTENFYGTSATITGTAAAFDNLNIQTGAVVSLPAGQEVKIGGTLTRTGTLTFQSTSSLGFNGGNQSVSLAGVTLAGITAYNSGSTRAVTLSGAITVLDSIKAETNTTLNTGGSLTLRSTSALTARVAQSLGTISGNAIVQTFIPGGSTGWANLGVRGVNGQTVANWDTYVSSSGANGIPMTCGGCANTQTAAGSWFESIQGWNETIDTYDTNIVSTTALTPGRGFWVYVGDGSSSTNGLTLINTGSLVQGAVGVPVTSGGAGVTVVNVGTVFYNLVANPYASPISWDKLFFGNSNNGFNFSGTIYAFNADLGAYTSYNNMAQSPGGPGSLTDVIPGGQGFYVEFIPNGGTTIDFTENMKVDNSAGFNPLLRPATSSAGQIFRLKIAGSVDWDATTFRIHPNATMNYDRRYDAHKLFVSPGYVGYSGTYSKYTTISSKDGSNDDYSINSLPMLTQSLSIPILAKVSATGSYTISALDFQSLDNSVCITLHDKLNNTYHDLRQGNYVVSINDTTNNPRFELILCKDQSVNPVGVSENTDPGHILISQDQEGAFVKTLFSHPTKATISVFNIMGQKLMNDVVVEGTSTSTHLNLNVHNQVVLIKVTTDRESTTKKIIAH